MQHGIVSARPVYRRADYHPGENKDGTGGEHLHPDEYRRQHHQRGGHTFRAGGERRGQEQSGRDCILGVRRGAGEQRHPGELRCSTGDALAAHPLGPVEPAPFLRTWQ